MKRQYELEYWRDGKWFVGRLVGVPGVFSQGETLEELEENIRDAFELMTADALPSPPDARVKAVEMEV